MAGIEELKSFFSKAQATGTKANVLSDLRWFIYVMLSGFLLAVRLSAPKWVIVFIAIMLGFGAILYLGLYIYFGITNPGALRSESFTLYKMAIEKTVIGDDLAGFIPSGEIDNSIPLIEPPTMLTDGGGEK
jgi:hypothetical protein